MRSYRIEEASAYFAQVTSRSSPTKTLVLRKTREIQQSRLGLRCSLLMDPGFRPGCSVVVGIVGLIAGADVIDMDAGYALCFVGEVPLRAQVARFQHRWCVVHPNALRPWRAGTDSVFIAPDPSELSTNAGGSAGLLTARCQFCWRAASFFSPAQDPVGVDQYGDLVLGLVPAKPFYARCQPLGMLVVHPQRAMHTTYPQTSRHRCQPPQTCQTKPLMSPASQTMAFKNEVVSDADIDRYNIPFRKGDRRWWTRDAERDYYLWGGLSGNLAYDDFQEGRFYLYVDGEVHGIKLQPGEFSKSLKDIPYIVCWESLLRIIPEPESPEREQQLISILKEALMVYGLYGEENLWPVETQVYFKF